MTWLRLGKYRSLLPSSSQSESCPASGASMLWSLQQHAQGFPEDSFLWFHGSQIHFISISQTYKLFLEGFTVSTKYAAQCS